ncbi:hypothetical protein LEN26_012362 [Aphanomyces euteiches]|nr:hypothetical protein LEN26_012362 [Aphanomyces euteiches]
MSLMCLIIGDGTPFVVDIGDRDRVAHLKQRIKDVKPSLVECQAEVMTLYAASTDENWRVSGGTWLQVTDPSVELLKQSVQIPYVIQKIMDKSRELISANFIGNLFKKVLDDDNVIHVLVQLPPEERRRKRLRLNPPVENFDCKPNSLPSIKSQGIESVAILTEQFQGFKNAFLVSKRTGRVSIDYIISTSKIGMPYLNEVMTKVFVRQSYKNIFELLAKITNGKTKFGISGTSGIGKSIFFVYILYRLLNGPCTFKPSRIIYQTEETFLLYDLENYVVSIIQHKSDVTVLLNAPSPLTFYIIDGEDSVPLHSACVALFISSPRSKTYQKFMVQKGGFQWVFPIWTVDELDDCRELCFPGCDKKSFENRYRIFGGVARPIFNGNGELMM